MKKPETTFHVKAADWNQALVKTRLRIEAELNVTSTPLSIGMPIAARAISILGQELGLVEVGGDTLAETEQNIILEASEG